MPRSSKDIAKRLRFDHRPRRDLFRRLYLPVGLIACGVGAALWVAFGRTAGERQYLPGPVSPAHATFGDRCAHCHVSFASVPNGKCLDCHAPRVHSEFEVETPACRDCHIEHRAPNLLLTVSNRACVGCHRDLHSRRQLTIAAHITGLADHPEFTPLRPDAHDTTALRFNHELHLTSEDVSNANDHKPLVCADCHVVSRDGGTMIRVEYEPHCQRCHNLKVKQAPGPIGDLEAPHDTPQAVRSGLTRSLLVLGAQQPEALFLSTQKVFIPGQPLRGAIDESKSLQEFQRKWLAQLETELYAPFVDQAPLLDNNKYCFLCHVEGEGRDAAGFPVVQETKLPARWLARAEFSHRKHDKLPCKACHGDLTHSSLTSDTNLPSLKVCQQCHVDTLPQSAGTQCTLCHLYHDTSKHPETHSKDQPQLTLEHLLGH
jgi:predicted CXXCH cytochrome family protein